MKKVSGKNGGFTLIELLLVIAIIGILAGAILVGIQGQRERAKRASAMQTAKSIVPYLAECYLRSITASTGITPPTSTSTGGGTVCGTSNVTWPSLAPTGCTWNITANDTTLDITCPGTNNNIVCQFTNGGDCW